MHFYCVYCVGTTPQLREAGSPSPTSRSSSPTRTAPRRSAATPTTLLSAPPKFRLTASMFYVRAASFH